MTDFVPSVSRQGFDVQFLRSAERLYNGSLVACGQKQVLVTRRINLAEKRSDIVWAKLNGTEVGATARIALPTPTGTEHLEDPRVITRGDDRFVAYTEGHYTQRPFLSVQRLARLNRSFEFQAPVPLEFGRNGRLSEKNWQFFVHDGALHFVYSLEPHTVVRISDTGVVQKVYETKAGLKWPFGTLSGSTPPVRVGDAYVSFFHSYARHPTRQRRYSVSAYEFEAKPPFRLLRLTEPLMFGSAHDPWEPHPLIAWWRPLVLFPCSARVHENGWVLCAGVSDFCNAMIHVPHERMAFQPAADFGQMRLFYFQTDAASGAIPQTSAARLRWQTYGPDIGGVKAGVICTCDPEAIASLSHRRGVTRISKERYESLVH